MQKQPFLAFAEAAAVKKREAVNEAASVAHARARNAVEVGLYQGRRTDQKQKAKKSGSQLKLIFRLGEKKFVRRTSTFLGFFSVMHGSRKERRSMKTRFFRMK